MNCVNGLFLFRMLHLYPQTAHAGREAAGAGACNLSGYNYSDPLRTCFPHFFVPKILYMCMRVGVDGWLNQREYLVCTRIHV